MIGLKDRENIIREYSEKFFKMELAFEVKFLINNYSRNAMSLIVPYVNLSKEQEAEKKKNYDEAIENLRLIEQKLGNSDFISKLKELYKSGEFGTEEMLNLILINNK
ncbi:MAG: hypothetical protein PHG82_03440 [Candidatus Gracilibacteria bacterium]|nr:hypothetical protein [Candidatus Gracilibacteria bacterium]